MTSLARMSGTSGFPTLDESVPSRSRTSTLDSLTRSRNPSVSQPQQAPTATQDDSPRARPVMPRRTSSAMHREVLTRLRPLPFQYIWSAWHSRPSSMTSPNSSISNASASPSSATSPAVSSNATSQPNSPTYGLTLLSSEVKDIAAFYRIFNNTPWSALKLKESIHFFRSGVRPLWEDPSNLQGGCWVLKLRKDDGKALRAWEEICLLALGGELQSAVAGQSVDRGDHVLGLSYSPRLYHAHISIWTQQGNNKDSVERLQMAVLEGLSEDLKPRSGQDYYYKVHSDHEGFENAVKALANETE